MKKLPSLFFIALLSCALGAFIAFKQSKGRGLQSKGVIKIGNWNLPPKMDLSNSIKARAKVALTGLFALRESEVLYAVANKDQQGRLLNGQYTYRVTGKDLSARYWSISLYGEDFFLIDNPENRFNINEKMITYDQNGNYSFLISPNKEEGLYLPSDQKQGFDLLLRIYGPNQELINNLEKLELPIIERID